MAGGRSGPTRPALDAGADRAEILARFVTDFVPPDEAALRAALRKGRRP